MVLFKSFPIKSFPKLIKWLVLVVILVLMMVMIQFFWNTRRDNLTQLIDQSVLSSSSPASIISDARPTQPVHIRVGVIVEIGADYLILETEKLSGSGLERLRVRLTTATEIIEIQIPSYMNESLRKLLAQGGEVIPRLTVSRDNLHIGQTVEVISPSDMYGYQEVTAARIEYKVVVDTQEDL